MNKRKTTIAALALFISGSLCAQHSTTMTKREQALVPIAAYSAKGELKALSAAIDRGFDAGLSVSEIKEALSHLYAYAGFPRSLNALGVLQQTIAERESKGLKVAPGREASPLPPTYNALTQGTKVQAQLAGAPFNYTFAPQTDYYLKAHLFGDIFARDNLSHADREIVTVSAIAALSGCEPQLKAHISGARNMGVSDAQLRHIAVVLEEEVGTKEATRCQRALTTVLGTPMPQATPLPVDFGIWPKGEPNPYGQYFTGKSYLAPMDAEHGGPTNVTFEPRCRNNWHIHHKQVQVLICVAGRVWYVEEGKKPLEMVPGTVVTIPAGVKHWHGAAHDSWFQHLTYHTLSAPDASTQWLEPVTDDEYNLANN